MLSSVHVILGRNNERGKSALLTPISDALRARPRHNPCPARSRSPPLPNQRPPPELEAPRPAPQHNARGPGWARLGGGSRCGAAGAGPRWPIRGRHRAGGGAKRWVAAAEINKLPHRIARHLAPRGPVRGGCGSGARAVSMQEAPSRVAVSPLPRR